LPGVALDVEFCPAGSESFQEAQYMSDPVRVVVFGATGTAGSAVVAQCLEDERISEVRAITRRPIGMKHRRLLDIHCHDFTHPESLAHQLTGVTACFFCLGTSRRRAGSDVTYREVTLTYPLAAADILRERSPEHTFVYLSAVGASPRGRVPLQWARVKGEAERQLRGNGLHRLFVARPGYIHPASGRGLSVLSTILPGLAITATDLARGMIEAALGDGDGGVLRTRELKRLAA
jgi:uncharacterized protein YbjT (DUF2867 family)